jgi:hypothetical protein
VGRVCPHLLGGGPLLALHARASSGAMGARGRRLVPGRITVTRAAPREVAAVCATTSCGCTRAVAGLPHHCHRRGKTGEDFDRLLREGGPSTIVLVPSSVAMTVALVALWMSKTSVWMRSADFLLWSASL